MNTTKERTQEQWLREEAYERRKRQREREQNDPEYAEYLAKQREYQKAWRERHPYYGQQWRDKNPHYQDPYNKAWRERQTEDDKKRMASTTSNGARHIPITSRTGASARLRKRGES